MTSISNCLLLLTFVLFNSLVRDEVGMYETVPTVRRLPRHDETVHSDLRKRNIPRRRRQSLVRPHEDRFRPRSVSGGVKR